MDSNINLKKFEIELILSIMKNPLGYSYVLKEDINKGIFRIKTGTDVSTITVDPENYEAAWILNELMIKFCEGESNLISVVKKEIVNHMFNVVK